MNAIRRMLFVAGALTLASILSACGGSSSQNPTSPTTAATAPPATPRPPLVLDRGEGNLPALVGLFRPLATTEVGSFDVTVEWTFPANDIDVFIARGNCSLDQLIADQCAVAAAAASSTAKPERLRLANQPAGTYTLIVVNFGPGDESIAYQAVFTPGTSAASAVHDSATVSLDKVRRLRRGIVEPE